MKRLQISILLGALFAPFSVYAHPGQEGPLHWLMHLFAGFDPLWGFTGGVIMVLGAWWIGRTPT